MHSLLRTDELTRTAQVEAAGSEISIHAGFDDLTLMKTSKSAFSGFPRDEFTTLSRPTTG